MHDQLKIRECLTIEELSECVRIQKEVFDLPDEELSPVRHLVVTKNAGGFTLGAFDDGRLAAFVLSVPAFLRGQKAFYSHMTGVRPSYQSMGIGASLKWAQRERALAEGVKYLKWTFEPVKARNAYFNLEKLGATVGEYQVDFYGTDYGTAPGVGLASDRLFAEWDLESNKVASLAVGNGWEDNSEPVQRIRIMNDWAEMVAADPAAAAAEQLRIRGEFQQAFGDGLIGRGFRRGQQPEYLLFEQW